MKVDSTLERLLCEWLECEADESVEGFISRHPEHDALLREHFALQELVEHAFDDLPSLPERFGPFRVETELGTGGMGTVYRAVVADPVRGLETGRTVALKVVHPHLFRTAGFFKRFLREAELGRQIDHPNVVRTLDADAVEIDDRPQHFLVMEYVEGRTLRELLDDVDRVPEELARHIGCEVARALSAIHGAGAVHRDLKPENVLITTDHEVKVMDLGVARLADEQVRLSQTGAFVGSLHYAAPEQFGGGDRVDHRADLHGLGLLLYEIATGTHPYADEDARAVMRRILSESPRQLGELNPQLSPFFEEVVARLLEKDPGSRFASAEELLDVLGESERSAWWRSRARELRETSKRPLRRVRIPRETALYGRDAELDRLRGLYEAAKSGDGRVVLIDGEAGIGKTRLVDEFVAQLQRGGEDLNFVFASYPPGGAATAAGAFSAAYREHLGGHGLEDALTELLPQTPILVPAFAALLRGDAAPKDSEPLTKDALQTCFAHLTRNLAAERTTIVLIDDLHFAPEEGRALFTAVALAAPGYRFLLIGSMRPGVPEDWTAGVTRLPQTSHLTIPRLGPKDLVLLLGDSFRSQRLAEELAGKIAIKSDGNPFFVFEIVQGLREGQFITQRPDGTWQTTRLIEDIQVPSSVLDLVNARVADLDADDRSLLDVAACWGYEFDPALVGDVLGIPRIPLLNRFGQIERAHRLVRASGRRYVFDHHQVQEALYGSLHEQMREEYHAALGAALETRERATESDPTDLSGALCVDLCRHYLAGARGESARRYLDAALDHLETGYQNAQAVSLADRALEVPDLVRGEERVELLLRKATRLDLLSRRDSERAALDEAHGLAETNGEPVLLARVQGSLGVHLWNVDRYDKAGEVLRRAIDRARGVRDRGLELRFTVALASVFYRQCRYEEAAEHYARCLASSREIGDRRGEADAAKGLGNVSLATGDYEEAREFIGRSLAVYGELDDKRGEAGSEANLGFVLLEQGRYAEARRHVESSMSLSREIGYRRGEAQAVSHLWRVLRAEGRHEEADDHLENALTLHRETGAKSAESIATGNLAIRRLERGRYMEGLAWLEKQLILVHEMGYRQGEAICLVNLGSVHTDMGRADVGRERLLDCLAMCREMGERRVEGYALQGLGLAAEGLGEVEVAERHYREALLLRRQIGYQAGIAMTTAALGSLMAMTGREEEAAALLSESAATARAVGVPGALVLSRCYLGLLRCDNSAAAREAWVEFGSQLGPPQSVKARFLLWMIESDPTDLAEAHRLLMFLREHAPEDCRETILENVPLHRDIVAAWRAQETA